MKRFLYQLKLYLKFSIQIKVIQKMSLSSLKVLVNTFFLVNQVSGFINQLHQLGQIVGPIVKHVAGIFALLEMHDSRRTVCFRLHRLAYDHLRQELLRFGRREVQEFRYAGYPDAGVVFSHHADVVLYHSTPENGLIKNISHRCDISKQKSCFD